MGAERRVRPNLHLSVESVGQHLDVNRGVPNGTVQGRLIEMNSLPARLAPLPVPDLGQLLRSGDVAQQEDAAIDIKRPGHCPAIRAEYRKVTGQRRLGDRDRTPVVIRCGCKRRSYVEQLVE